MAEDNADDWWRNAVVYEVYPRSFNDANGDGEGDFRGIIDKMDYLHDLGADALWLTPFYPSPLADVGMMSPTIAAWIPGSGHCSSLPISLQARTNGEYASSLISCPTILRTSILGSPRHCTRRRARRSGTAIFSMLGAENTENDRRRTG